MELYEFLFLYPEDPFSSPNHLPPLELRTRVVHTSHFSPQWKMKTWRNSYIAIRNLLSFKFHQIIFVNRESQEAKLFLQIAPVKLQLMNGISHRN